MSFQGRVVVPCSTSSLREMAAVTVAVVSAWLLRLAEAVELTGLQQPELLAFTLEASLGLFWVKVGV